MTRPQNPDSREMTRRAPNDVKATRESIPRAIGRNVADSTPYDGDERTLADHEVSKERKDQSKRLDDALEEAKATANSNAANPSPKAQLSPSEDDDEPDTIARGKKAAPPATRRDAGQSRTGEG
jgi:hypothetical protein